MASAQGNASTALRLLISDGHLDGEDPSVERDPFREEQLLQSLLVVERRLHPKV